MLQWGVSMALATWPEGASWTGMLCEHRSCDDFDDAKAGLDQIENWSLAGREGQLPLVAGNVPVTVHGRLCVLDPADVETFVVVVTWTPWQASDGFEGHSEPQPRRWAEAEVARFLDDPYEFAPDGAHAGTAIGLFNKLQGYVGQRRHVTDHTTLGAGWIRPD